MFNYFKTLDKLKTKSDPAAVRMVFSLIGKFFGALVLSACYAYTSELFHTSARSAALGLCSTFGRIGGILAPTIVKTV